MTGDTNSAETIEDGPKSRPDRTLKTLYHVVWRGLIAAVLLGVLAWSAYHFTHRDHAPQPGQSAASDRLLSVGVITIAPRDVPMSSQFLAQTEPSETVPIRTRVSGVLVERSFEEGQAVEKGQVLFRIDPKPFQVTLRQAEARLKAAEAQLLRAEQQVRRFQELAQVQQAAANELEQAQEAQRITAAAVETQRALIEQAQLDLDYATIASPISGVIGMRQQDVGSYIGTDTDTLLATVRRVDPIYVRYSVSEQDLLRWQRLTESGLVTNVAVDELTITVILPDGHVFPHTGRIDYVDVAVDPSRGTAVIRATVPNPDRTLRPGQFVHVEISGIHRLGAIAIPQSAVTQTPSGAAVYVIDAEDRAQIRPVTVGDWVGNDWLVESGLNPGDRLIIDHLMQVRPGLPVQPTEISIEPRSAAQDQ